MPVLFLQTQGNFVFRKLLIKGQRVIITHEGYEHMFKLVHIVHQGISGMEFKTWDIIWKSNMQKEIEQMINSCSRCQMFARKNPKMKSLKRELELSLERIRIDYVISFEGKHFHACL